MKIHRILSLALGLCFLTSTSPVMGAEDRSSPQPRMQSRSSGKSKAKSKGKAKSKSKSKAGRKTKSSTSRKKFGKVQANFLKHLPNPTFASLPPIPKIKPPQGLPTMTKEAALAALEKKKITPEQYDQKLLENLRDPHLVACLLKAGANPNAAYSGKHYLAGRSAVRQALAEESLESFFLLYNAGADLDVGSDGLLSYAPNRLWVHTLVAMGADPKHRDKEGKSVIMQSMGSNYGAGSHRGGNLDIIHGLIEAGADVMQKDNEGNTALHDAAEAGSSNDVLAYLLHYIDVNARNRDGETPLFGSTRSQNTEFVMPFLIAAGADVNARDKEGRTCLMSGMDGGSSRHIAILVRSGADINAQDNSGKSALHYAVGSKSQTEACIRAGANVNAADKEGNTPLHGAYKYHGNEKAAPVQLLLEHGANPDLKNKSGKTPAEMMKS